MVQWNLTPGQDNQKRMYRLRVKEVLEQRQKTQSWLSRRSGVPQNLIRRMLKEPDTYKPSYAILAQVAEALRVPIDDLIEKLPDPDEF
ncbi:helix-turn-helix domain-containing protein [Thermogemmatispora sp.]|jgi:transcriptional regulator with XRE-family HTH domain|uniref:helix-turn-helix domain-containing protein n=1 Tax=Thermogemmatispora sp. TaxID=1968838 RepID=UPI0035E4428C